MAASLEQRPFKGTSVPWTRVVAAVAVVVVVVVSLVPSEEMFENVDDSLTRDECLPIL